MQMSAGEFMKTYHSFHRTSKENKPKKVFEKTIKVQEKTFLKSPEILCDEPGDCSSCSFQNACVQGSQFS